MHTNNRQDLIADIIFGIVGAFVGGYFPSPLFNVGRTSEGDFSFPAQPVSLEGAVIFLIPSNETLPQVGETNTPQPQDAVGEFVS